MMNSKYKKTIVVSIFCSLASLIICSVFISCQDTLYEEQISSEFVEGELGTVKLAINVNALNVESTRSEDPSETEEGETPEEKNIENIWVFQFDSNGNLLIYPRYYTKDNSNVYDEENNIWTVYLALDKESQVYVVANTGNDSWASVSADFNTLDKLKSQTLTNPQPIVFSDESEDNFIPMEGITEAITPTINQTIEVAVTRMYAKVKVRVNFSEILDYYYNDIEIDYVNVANIPLYCRVNSLANDEQTQDDSVDFPQGTDFRSQVFTGINSEEVDEDDYPYVVYVPENLRGETDNEIDYPDEKATNAPNDALSITIRISFKNSGTDVSNIVMYTVYPGGNDYNNFNIRRNDVYRVTFNVGYPLEEAAVPSANCICGFAGETLSFYPYYREETGGNGSSDYYKFSTYLDPEVDSKTIKGLKIIWQTEGCIGDNSNGDLVYLIKDESQTNSLLQDKIYVKTSAAGNALIAAYNDEDCEGDILWSWHIWVRDKDEGDPTNIANAITYYTYDWDNSGIHYQNSRKLGYPVMNCNIGALTDEPVSTAWADYTQTYGNLYQWGRKDPFPPCKCDGKKNYLYNYDEANAHVVVYDNNNQKINMTDNDGTPGSSDGYAVFNTILTTDFESQTCEGGIKYSIQNPTIFIAAAKAFTSSSNYDDPEYYMNQGDWLPVGDDYLWGGTDEYTMRYVAYSLTSGNTFTATLKDNYGPNKTIFDPCPYGWRTAPGDIWLGFTSNGKNSSNVTNINCVEETFTEVADNYGFHLYMQGWKQGQASFFPTQGSRTASGQPTYGGICGNYHNATADELVDISFNDEIYENACRRVDILHTHCYSETNGNINTFENQIVYSNRAVAGPVRCVRETK